MRTTTGRTEKSVQHTSVQRLHTLEIASATPQVIPEDIPVHGGEKPETNCVNSKTVPVTKPIVSKAKMTHEVIRLGVFFFPTLAPVATADPNTVSAVT